MADLDTIESLLTDLNARMESAPEPMNDEQIRTIVNELLSTRLADPDDEVYRKLRFGTGGDQRLVGSKFARYNLDTGDIELLHQIMSAAQGQSRKGGGIHPGPSEALNRGFAAVSEARYMTTDELERLDYEAVDGVYPRVTRAGRLASERRIAEIEHARAMDSAETGYGLELIGVQYLGELWDAARTPSRIFPLIDSFEMAHPTTTIPVEADLPELLFVSEKTGPTDSDYATDKTGSQNVDVVAKKFILHQIWSGELEEDSIIPFIPYLRRQAGLSLGHYLDALIINGDTTNAGTGNINLDDADPADTKYYLALDAIRHAPLVDNTTNGHDVAGAVSAGTFLKLKSLMQDAAANVPMHWGFPTMLDDLVFAMDYSTYLKLIDLDEFVTVDKFGPRATIHNGQVGSIWGHPVIPTEAVSLTEADGKVSTTAANNTKGQVVCFNRRGFKWGWRRRVMVETERLPGRDQTRLIYSLRGGFGRYTTTGAAAGIEAAAVGYNITV